MLFWKNIELTRVVIHHRSHNPQLQTLGKLSELFPDFCWVMSVWFSSQTPALDRTCQRHLQPWWPVPSGPRLFHIPRFLDGYPAPESNVSSDFYCSSALPALNGEWFFSFPFWYCLLKEKGQMTRARKVSFLRGWRLRCTFFGSKAEKVVCYIRGTQAVTSIGVYQEASIKTADEFWLIFKIFFNGDVLYKEWNIHILRSVIFDVCPCKSQAYQYTEHFYHTSKFPCSLFQSVPLLQPTPSMQPLTWFWPQNEHRFIFPIADNIQMKSCHLCSFVWGLMKKALLAWEFEELIHVACSTYQSFTRFYGWELYSAA